MEGNLKMKQLKRNEEEFEEAKREPRHRRRPPSCNGRGGGRCGREFEDEDEV